MLDEKDEEDFRNFQQRRDTIRTNVENLGKMRFPGDEEMHKQLMKTVDHALHQEEMKFKIKRKTVKRRRTLKKMGKTDAEIENEMQKADY